MEIVYLASPGNHFLSLALHAFKRHALELKETVSVALSTDKTKYKCITETLFSTLDLSLICCAANQ